MQKRTIVEIAEQVGVSIATVSRALNNQPGVSEDRRREIVRIASELQYHPNAIARSLQGQRTNTIAFLIEVNRAIDSDLFFFKEFITKLAARCAHHQRDLLLHPVEVLSTELQPESGKPVQRGRADGIMLADVRQHDSRVAYLKRMGLPFVGFGRDASEDHPWIDVDGEAGIAMATDLLIQRGHRRIAFLGIPEDYSCGLHRKTGFLRALKSAGIPADDALQMSGLRNTEETNAAIYRLLMHPNPPTAFVSASDSLAFQAMTALGVRGLQAGRDYAITGFDDGPLAERVPPGLTTLHQPIGVICDSLVAMLDDIVHNVESERHVLLVPELIVRGTTG